MRRKAIPIILPANVRNIRLKSVLVPVTIIISNVMPLPGVRITAIILRPVLCRLLLMINARTANLIIKVVKKTGREPAVNKAMSTLVLRDAFMQHQTAVHGIILTVNVVPLLRRQVVRPIIRSPVTRPAAHPVLILADIPVIVAVMIPVRPVLLKTITDLMLLLPNAVPDVTDVKTVLPAAGLIPDLMLDLQSAEAAMLVLTPAAQGRNPYLALPIM